MVKMVHRWMKGLAMGSVMGRQSILRASYRLLAIMLVLAAITGLMGGVLVRHAWADDSQRTSAEESGSSVGDYLPSEYVMDPVDNVSTFDVDYNLALQSAGQETVSVLAASELPQTYVPSISSMPAVRNQGSYGTCWAHAMMAVMEFAAMKQGLATSSVDQSELQTVYFMYNKGTIADPLDQITYDYNTKVQGSYLFTGNLDVACRLLASWCGSVDESLVPYANAGHTVSSRYAYNRDAYHLTSTQCIPFSDEASIKQAIRECGAVGFSYYEQDSSYNSRYNSYYDAEHEDTNHAVAIVGWNDTFSRNNFSGSTKPSRNGAWLVRNSWGGSGFDHNGYFWLSYDNKCLNGSYAVAATVEDSSVHNNNYQWDGTAAVRSTSLKSGEAMANIYTAHGNSSGYEILDSIGVDIWSSGLKYSIQIYKDIKDTSDPRSGTPCLSEPTTGTTGYSGLLSIPLSERVILREGETFSVVITNVGSTDKTIGCEWSYSNGVMRCYAHTEAGQSLSGGNGWWYDLNNEGMCARIKAYTKNAYGPVSLSSYGCVTYMPKITYCGTSNAPSLQVRVSGTTLREGQDYVVGTSGSKNVGQATFTVYGLGDYSGSMSCDYSIEPAKLTATYGGETADCAHKASGKVTVTGFVGSENEGNAAGYSAPTLSLPSVMETGKSYTLMPQGGSATNYVFEYVSGTLTVKDHAWGSWKRMKEPTETSYGVEQRVCSVDSSHVESRRVDAVTPSDPVRAFASRLYTKILDRLPDSSGYEVQVQALRSGTAPAEIAYNYFAGSEYQAKGESSSQTVERVYQVMFGRASDASGKDMWVKYLDSGMSVRAVIAGFSQSEEYKYFFSSMGVDNSTIGVYEPRDKNPGVTGFCGRLYTQCLGRAFDVDGINVQARAILGGTSASQIAVNFFTGAEFKGLKLSNDQTIERCYKTMMGRASDADGKKFWLGKMASGMSVENLVRGFAQSIEWSEICAKYGVTK